jgi:hypothetical protein
MSDKTVTTKDELIVALTEPEHAYAVIVDDPSFKDNAREIKRFYRDNAGHDIRRVDRATALKWMNNFLEKRNAAAA